MPRHLQQPRVAKLGHRWRVVGIELEHLVQEPDGLSEAPFGSF